MIPEHLAKIEARARAAKAYEYQEQEQDSGYFFCPLCGSEEMEGRLYDAKNAAATVIAYGIGESLRQAEEWVEYGPDDALALVAEVRRLTAKLEEMGI